MVVYHFVLDWRELGLCLGLKICYVTRGREGAGRQGGREGGRESVSQ